MRQKVEMGGAGRTEVMHLTELMGDLAKSVKSLIMIRRIRLKRTAPLEWMEENAAYLAGQVAQEMVER